MQTISGSSSRARAQSGCRVSGSTAAAHEVVERGISQAPEGRRIFPRMTVRENLEMGAFTRTGQRGIDADFERVFGCSRASRSALTQNGGTLSGGEQQMLAIGRALMARPRCCCWTSRRWALRRLRRAIFEIVKDINGSGTTVLLVEQNALMALGIAKRGYILQTGEIVLQDWPTA